MTGQTSQSTLSQDLLPSVEDIAAHVYGEATATNVRRIRHLIAVHGFPHKKVGGKIESKKSWIDAYYAEPDSATGTRK
jgi:hypothetical protein